MPSAATDGTSRRAGPARPRTAVDRAGFLCLYGIVPAGSQVGGTGVDDSPVEVLPCGPTAVLASPLGSPRVRPSRANVLAHQLVVDRAHADGPVVPIRFGTVVPRTGAVAGRVIDDRDGRLPPLLDRLRGKDEFRIRLAYEDRALLGEVVARSPYVRRSRERTRHRADRDLMIDLGQAVRAEMERIMDTDAAAVIAAVGPDAIGSVRLPARGEAPSVAVALLVERRSRDRLDRAVDALAGAIAGRARVEMVGPLPPWDFAESGIGD